MRRSGYEWDQGVDSAGWVQEPGRGTAVLMLST